MEAQQEKYLYQALTYRIIGALMRVHSELGCGFLERIYQKAVEVELKKEDIDFETEKEITIYYNGKSVGKFRLDMLIEGKVILEIKAVSKVEGIFKAQLISYLKATRYQIGVLANFGTPKLQYFRLFREHKGKDKVAE